MNHAEQLARALKSARRVAVLTGAGISTDSGIPDFRSRGGLYDRHVNIEAVLSETYFRRSPDAFWPIYKSVFQLEHIRQYEPNAGHYFLKELKEAGQQVTVITQNVDGLHDKAGSSRVLNLHGSVYKAYCTACHREYGPEHLLKEEVPRCEADGCMLKPDVVLFEGRVRHMEEAYAAVGEADVFMAVGTSLNVYPANELPAAVRNAPGVATAIINREPTLLDRQFRHVFHDGIANVFAQMKAAWQA